MILNFLWIQIVLPLRVGYEPRHSIPFEIALIDLIIDIIFFINLIIGFFIPLKADYGKNYFDPYRSLYL